jgi:hypothetical protein
LDSAKVKKIRANRNRIRTIAEFYGKQRDFRFARSKLRSTAGRFRATSRHSGVAKVINRAARNDIENLPRSIILAIGNVGELQPRRRALAGGAFLILSRRWRGPARIERMTMRAKPKTPERPAPEPELVPVKTKYPARPPAHEPLSLHLDWIATTAGILGRRWAKAVERQLAWSQRSHAVPESEMDEHNWLWNEIIPLWQHAQLYLPLETLATYRNIRGPHDALANPAVAAAEWERLANHASDMNAKATMTAPQAKPNRLNDTQNNFEADDPEFPPGEWIDPEFPRTRYKFGRRKILWELWRALRTSKFRIEHRRIGEYVPSWRDGTPEPATVKTAVSNLRSFFRSQIPPRNDLAESLENSMDSIGLKRSHE